MSISRSSPTLPPSTVSRTRSWRHFDTPCTKSTPRPGCSTVSWDPAPFSLQTAFPSCAALLHLGVRLRDFEPLRVLFLADSPRLTFGVRCSLAPSQSCTLPCLRESALCTPSSLQLSQACTQRSSLRLQYIRRLSTCVPVAIDFALYAYDSAAFLCVLQLKTSQPSRRSPRCDALRLANSISKPSASRRA